MHWGDYGWGMGVGGWLLMALIWIVVILGIVFLIKLTTGTRNKIEKETALGILEKRYARGEISKEEFEQIRNDLTKS